MSEPRSYAIRIWLDPGALAAAAARRFTALARAAIDERSRFAVALAGGRTPLASYRQLADGAAGAVDWSRVHLFWGDERCVPPDHPDSNYGAVREALLRYIDIPADNVHRIAGERDPAEAALLYEATLRAWFAADARFDLVLLGLGSDGHTASLFPETMQQLADADADQRWVVATRVRSLAAWRITLTPRAINAAAQVLFLVSGADKAPAVRTALQGGGQQGPARQILPVDGRLEWYLDGPAATLLPWHPDAGKQAR